MDFKKNYKIRLSLLIYLGNVNFKSENEIELNQILKEIESVLPRECTVLSDYKTGKISLNNLAKSLCLIFIQINKMKLIAQYFDLSYHSLSKTETDEKIVIGDFACRNNRLIELFKNCLEPIYRKRILLLTQFKDENEMIYPSLDKIFKKDERILLPKGILSLGLFCVEDEEDLSQLKLVIEQDLMAYNGKVVIEVNKDLLKDVFGFIYDKLSISEIMQQEDHFILLLNKKMNELDFETIEQNEQILKDYNKNAKPIEISDNYHIVTLPYIDYEWKCENFKITYNENLIKSDLSSDLWQDMMALTSVNNHKNESLTFPKTPKNEEISLILSSGIINGEIELEEGKGKHYLVGGQCQTEIKDIVEKEIKGEIVEMESYKRINELVLNLLITKDGYYEIKKLVMEK